MRPCLALALLVLTACRSTPAPAPEAAAPSPGRLVAVTASACQGRCRAFTLEVEASGAVRFVGQRFVAQEGEARWQLDAAALAKVRALVAGLDSSGWNRKPGEKLVDAQEVTVEVGGSSYRFFPVADETPANLRPFLDALERESGARARLQGEEAER